MIARERKASPTYETIQMVRLIPVGYGAGHFHSRCSVTGTMKVVADDRKRYPPEPMH